MNFGSIDIAVGLSAAALLGLLLFHKIRNNQFWQATVTPLASIIGSGFLIAAPILGEALGNAAPYAMIGIIIFAFAIGEVIRFNIAYTEPLLQNGSTSRFLAGSEFISALAVFCAYLISVAFYLRVMAAFLLTSFELDTPFNANLLTTVFLVAIGVIGLFRGLKTLEALEEYSVSIKLAIIGASLVGLIWYMSQNGHSLPEIADIPFTLNSLPLLGGMLLVVQGFETSRYLGDEYSAKTRISSMRLAQILAGIIYIGFVFLVTPLLGYLNGKTGNEAAIIDLMKHVSLILPFLLIIAAAFSQFSAAVADTLSGGGIIREESQKRLPARVGYALIAIGAGLLVWNVDIFEIVAYASRAFAFYYFTQAIIAIYTSYQCRTGSGRTLTIMAFTPLAMALLWIVFFAVPVE
jgi:hypothetical protein